jgi:hypothetical protein
LTDTIDSLGFQKAIDNMTRKNKHGLSASRPKDVDEKVRRRCGYGCVICGCAIYDYHHFDPPFSEAKGYHNPDGITLLCGQHHDFAHSGLLPVSVIREANQNPKCLEDGFSHAPFYIDQSPIVIIGDITFIDTPIIIEAFGEPIIQIEPSEERGTPFKLSGVFYDSEGNRIFEICQNELRNPIGDWDIEVKRPRIIIQRASGEVALQIRAESPRLIIEKIDMFYEGFRIKGEQDEAITFLDRNGSPFYVISPAKTKEFVEGITNPFLKEARQKKLARLSSEGLTYKKCKAGIILRSDGTIDEGGRECENLPLNSSSILLTG